MSGKVNEISEFGMHQQTDLVELSTIHNCSVLLLFCFIFSLGAGLEEVAAREAVRLRRLEHVHVPVGIRGYGERANCRF